MRTLLAKLSQRLRSLVAAIDICDAHAYGGLLLIAWGAYQIYPPAAPIICGAALFWLGVKS